MKKNFSVNIQGRLFHIDEDAYELLEEYFDYLNAGFENETEKQEIIDDFHKRISEELWELTKGDNQHIVNILHVRKVLAGLGYSGQQDKQENNDKTRTRRLFRHPDDRLLGGVCGGIAQYFNIDPLIVRIIFVVLFFTGAGFLAYLIMWIVVPLARSPLEKLNMSGDEITLDKVKGIIKDEFTEVEKSFKRIKKKGIPKEKLNEIENEIRDFIKASVFVRVISGSFLIALSLFLIAGLIIVILLPFHVGTFQGIEVNSFNKLGHLLFNSSVIGIVFKWAVFFMLVIPFTGILLFGFSVVSGLSFRTGMLRWLSQYTGTVSLIIFLFCLAFVYLQFLFQSKTETALLYDSNYYAEFKIELSHENSKKSNTLSGKPEISILPGNDTLKAIIQKRSYGRTNSAAQLNTANLNYGVFSKNDTIFVDSKWVAPSLNWRGQNVKLTLFIPPGKRFNMSGDFTEYFFPKLVASSGEKKRYRYRMTNEGPVTL